MLVSHPSPQIQGMCLIMGRGQSQSIAGQEASSGQEGPLAGDTFPLPFTRSSLAPPQGLTEMPPSLTLQSQPPEPISLCRATTHGVTAGMGGPEALDLVGPCKVPPPI